MGRLTRYTCPSKIRAAEAKGKRSNASCNLRGRRCVTPMRTSHLKPYLHKKSRSKYLGRVLSPVSEGDSSQGDLKPHCGRCIESPSSLRVPTKNIVTSSTKDPCQDSTSMILPSGVSSFLMDCLDLDSEAEVTLPSIETVRKAETCDGLMSDDEILPTHVKNSTLLDLSHAVDIAKQKSPNLSSILEWPSIVDRRAIEESISLTPPQPVSPLCFSPLAGLPNNLGSSKNTPEREIKPVAFEERTPVTFRSLVLSPVMKKRRQTYDVQKSHMCKLRENAVSGVRKELITPQGLPTERAKFFDFANESDKEAFFQRLKRTFTFQFPAKLITFTDLPVTEDM